MNWLELGNLASAVAVSLALNSVWLGLLVTALAAGMIRLMPRSNATTRYAIWFIALVLAIAAPGLLLIPRPVEAVASSVAVAPAAPLAVPAAAQWPAFAVLAWIAIAAILLARVAWSIVYIHGLKSRSTLLCQRGGIRVLASAEVRSPMAAGFLRRAIVFPQSLIDELTSEEFEQVLCHEMAHLSRWDDWTQLAHAVAQAVFFFNPAMYWIGRCLKIEREMACDDWVVSATGAARPYAACLTHLHELTRHAAAPQLAPGAVARNRWQLSTRVEALLRADRNSTPRFSRSGWMAAGAMACAALLVAARTAPPVGVQELPLATLALAHLNAPAAPAIALAPRAAPAIRPRFEASHPAHKDSTIQMAKAATPASPALIDGPIGLVPVVQLEVTPTYFVFTVVFIEPPPPPGTLNGI
ncbi:MAG: M56 family metallopeptidase [Bryobacteraceae bacterium]